MERRILEALQWRVNPPTSMDFVRSFMNLIPAKFLDKESRKLILELAKYQVDVSVVHYEFCTEKSSVVAFAALLNAMESVFTDGMLCTKFELVVGRLTTISIGPLNNLRARLYEAIVAKKSPALTLPKTIRKPSCHTKGSLQGTR